MLGSGAPERTASALPWLIPRPSSQFVFLPLASDHQRARILPAHHSSVSNYTTAIYVGMSQLSLSYFYDEAEGSLPRPVISRLTDFRWPAAPNMKQMSPGGAPNQNRQNRLPKQAHT